MIKLENCWTLTGRKDGIQGKRGPLNTCVGQTKVIGCLRRVHCVLTRGRLEERRGNDSSNLCGEVSGKIWRGKVVDTAD